MAPKPKKTVPPSRATAEKKIARAMGAFTPFAKGKGKAKAPNC